jgi:cytochrome c-type biogenesis protein CcmH/NrfG
VKFWVDWEWREAEVAFRHAIEIDPSYSLAHRMLGIALSHLGRHDEAAAATSRARELDPLLAGHHALSSQVAFGARDFHLAARFARQAIALDPEFWVGHMQLAQALEQLGDRQRALDALNDAGRLSGGNSKALALRGYVLAKSSRREDALEVVQLLDAAARERHVPPYAWALIHLGLGENDQALERLQRAKQTRDVHVSFLYIDPKWDPLRADPRFAALLEECACTA